MSAATVSRYLTRRGLVTPEPKKRPKSSYLRFAAELPNECWQSDFTHYRLTRPDGRPGADIEILAWLDDHSRLILHLTCHRRVTGPAVVTFRACCARYGIPASTLTDIQAVSVFGMSCVVRPAVRGFLVTGACPLSLLTDRSAQLRDFLPVDHGAGRGAAEDGTSC